MQSALKKGGSKSKIISTRHITTLCRNVSVPILELFLDKHNLAYGKMKKEEKLQAVSAWLANWELNKIWQKGVHDEESGHNDDDDDKAVYSDDSDDENDLVLL